VSAPKTSVVEGVAVIGMACRFPGANDIEEFWRALMSGQDMVSRVPDQRWDANAHPDFVSNGGFVGDVEGFDTGFFAVSESEAAYMCPQQRLLLELAWHVLEHASVVPSSLKNTDTGVFVGLCGHDFSILHWRQQPNLYLGTGTSNAVAANRISFQLGLNGPSFAVDAACSSSLVAVHLACRSIIAGECEQALAGSSNVLLIPEVTASLAEGGLISPDGRCKSFGTEANGYVRSEGAGMVLLKRLDLAERDGDRILGVIAASGINHNGRSNGLTAPNPIAQAALIRKCIAQSGLHPASIDYLEAAATGTRLGDAIEVKAIKDSLLSQRGDAPALTVGSLKSNIGHLEGTGGIAGLIKLLLCIQHGQIPASLHSATLNPLCQIDSGRLHVPQRAIEWTRPLHDRVAAVSSFGFGGSNAHVVVRGAAATATAPLNMQATARMLPLSAQSPAALQALFHMLDQQIAASATINLDALAATAALGREHHRHRAAIVFSTREELRAALAGCAPDNFQQAPSHAIVLRGALDGLAPQLAALAACNRDFSAVIDTADSQLAGRLSVRSWLAGTTIENTQQALLKLALDHCLASWLGTLLQSPLTYVAEGTGEIAAAMLLLSIPLEHAEALLHGRYPALATPAPGKRLPLHVPQSPQRNGRSWPWTAALAPAMPDPQRCPLLDISVLDASADRFPAELLGLLYLGGARIDWTRIHPRAASRHATFPLYPFQRSRHWPEQNRGQTAIAGASVDSGLVGNKIVLPLSDERRRGYRFEPARSSVLAEHAIEGGAILSAAAQLAICAQALLDEFASVTTITLADASFLAPVYLEHERAVEAQLLIQPAGKDSGRCVLVASDGAEMPRWEVVFSTEYGLDRTSMAGELSADAEAGAFEAIATDFYSDLAARGYRYGASYQWLRERGSDANDHCFRLANDDARPVPGVPWHPGLIDSCFHALALLTPHPEPGSILLPRAIGRMDLRRPQQPGRHYSLQCLPCAADPAGPHDLLLRDAGGHPIITLHAVGFGTVSRAAFAMLRTAASAGAAGEADPVGVHSTEALLKHTFDRVLGAPLTQDHLDRALPALGIDSLKAMELRGYLWRAFGADIGVAQLLGGFSFETLLQHLVANGKAMSPSLNPQPASAPAELDLVRFDDSMRDAPVEIEL
jgi:acyl transferase domain-containing protein/aryl carrier-like protein